MAEFKPVQTLAEVMKLDPHDLQLGYFDGLHGVSAPDQRFSRAYHHGWANGAVDAGLQPITPEQERLAEEVVQWQFDHRVVGKVH